MLESNSNDPTSFIRLRIPGTMKKSNRLLTKRRCKSKSFCQVTHRVASLGGRVSNIVSLGGHYPSTTKLPVDIFECS